MVPGATATTLLWPRNPRDRVLGRQKYWWIGNLDIPPWYNGWCYKEHIYGVLFEVSGVQPDEDDV